MLLGCTIISANVELCDILLQDPRLQPLQQFWASLVAELQQQLSGALRLCTTCKQHSNRLDSVLHVPLLLLFKTTTPCKQTTTCLCSGKFCKCTSTCTA
jgi:hypothetical protein